MENILLESTRATLQVAKVEGKNNEDAPFRARLVLDVDEVSLQVVVVAYATGKTRAAAVANLAARIAVISIEITTYAARPNHCEACQELLATDHVRSTLLPGSHCMKCGRSA